MTNGLPLYRFTYKPQFHSEYGSRVYIGVLAQDVEQVFPHAVTVGHDGFKQVDYSKIQEA